MRKWLKNNKLGLAIIFITWVIFFSRVLFGGQIYFLDDLEIIYYPLEHAYAQFQANFELPQWSTSFGFGHPLLGWGQLGFFNPLHLLLRALQIHPIVLLQISILTFFASGLLGMYVFLRRQKLHQLPAALGAIIFVFSGFHVGHLNHVNFFTATMWLPWLLLTISHFLHAPTLRKTALVAIIAALIPLSGQPQVSLYTLIIAAIYGSVSFLFQFKRNKNYESRIKNHAATKPRQGLIHYSLFIIQKRNFKIVFLTLAATLLFLSLSSFSLLPLFEFIPITERGADLPITELFEFSYPPSHAITLIAPFYFGDYSSYWGAKNFQELAAYTGIIPLLLAIASLFFWKAHKILAIFGLTLVAISIAMAPGIHSPIYRYLVENHIITTLSIPGRFVFFFDVGIALLAALGLQHISKKIKRIRASSGDVVRPAPVSKKQELGSQNIARLSVITITIAAIANLLYFGWNYNPMVPANLSLKPSPFANTLKNFRSENGYPARIYGNESLPVSGENLLLVKPTDAISPIFTIHQPIDIGDTSACIRISMAADNNSADPIQISLKVNISEPPVYSIDVTADDLENDSSYIFCPPNLNNFTNKSAVISFTSSQISNLKLLYRSRSPQEQPVLFVRVKDPTKDQLERSKKDFHLLLSQEGQQQSDLTKDLLLRHTQVTANASSARWIGALSVKRYRDFIEAFFANDTYPIDGDGNHAIISNRKLLDMAGVTHLSQAIPAHKADQDAMLSSGFELVAESIQGTSHLRLYQNPQAFPKAHLVPNAIWKPAADETRFALLQPEFDPLQTVYLSGERPPSINILSNDSPPEASGEGRANISAYTNSRVDINVSTNKAAWLILNDAYTPQWQVTVDGESSPAFAANSVFRAVFVPAGEHTITWQYKSPAIDLSKKLTIGGLVIVILLLLAPIAYKTISARNKTH